MGRIKTQRIKAKTQEMMELHGEQFTTDYNKNKTIVEGLALIRSKKIRNVIAGYATRLKKSQAI
ncbi:MAG: 30S ribosomal protein S17e [archaeon]